MYQRQVVRRRLRSDESSQSCPSRPSPPISISLFLYAANGALAVHSSYYSLHGTLVSLSVLNPDTQIDEILDAAI